MTRLDSEEPDNTVSGSLPIVGLASQERTRLCDAALALRVACVRKALAERLQIHRSNAMRENRI
jgi:hypothetical protein